MEQHANDSSFWFGFAWAARRDIRLALARKGEWLTILGFFVVAASLFPFGIGADANMLARIAPGVIWVITLLATLLALPRLFQFDHADGTLEQMIASRASLSGIVAGKLAALWLTTALPILLVAPLIAMSFALPQEGYGVLVLSLALGTPLLTCIGGFGAALTLGLKSAQSLMALIALPLYVPVLIFGAGAVQSHVEGMGASGHLSLLAAGALVVVFATPWALAQTLKIVLE